MEIISVCINSSAASVKSFSENFYFDTELQSHLLLSVYGVWFFYIDHWLLFGMQRYNRSSVLLTMSTLEWSPFLPSGWLSIFVVSSLLFSPYSQFCFGLFFPFFFWLCVELLTLLVCSEPVSVEAWLFALHLPVYTVYKITNKLYFCLPKGKKSVF